MKDSWIDRLIEEGELDNSENLPIQKMQRLKPNLEELIDGLQEISAALDLPMMELLQLVILDSKYLKSKDEALAEAGSSMPDKDIPDLICEVFPNLPNCKKQE